MDVLHGVALAGGLDTDEQAAAHGEAPDAQMRARSRESNDHLIADRGDLFDRRVHIRECGVDVPQDERNASSPDRPTMIARVLGEGADHCLEVAHVRGVEVRANGREIALFCSRHQDPPTLVEIVHHPVGYPQWAKDGPPKLKDSSSLSTT